MQAGEDGCAVGADLEVDEIYADEEDGVKDIKPEDGFAGAKAEDRDGDG